MTHRVEEISRYRFKPSDELLVDTNIWLLVYAPQKPGDSRVAVYSDAFYKILAAQSQIYIDVLIVSEFITQYARLKHQLLAPKLKFKDFRRSQDFKSVAQDIASDVKRILKHCAWMENSFESLAIDALIDEYAIGESDFNDQIIITLCKSKGLKLVTDDGDFKNCGIPVVTANKRLLA
jgi:predicted nucleic acid-binding protein